MIPGNEKEIFHLAGTDEVGKQMEGTEGGRKRVCCFKIWYMEYPDHPISPFSLKNSRLNEEDSSVMLDVIEKRLQGRIWEEVSAKDIQKENFISREFIAWDSDGKSRAVANLSHFSEHYRPLPSKNETLEGFSASLFPRDYLITMDRKSGYNHFWLHKDMQKYFVFLVFLAQGTVRYFKYLVLPFGWTQSGHWFCRQIGRF